MGSAGWHLPEKEKKNTIKEKKEKKKKRSCPKMCPASLSIKMPPAEVRGKLWIMD